MTTYPKLIFVQTLILISVYSVDAKNCIKDPLAKTYDSSLIIKDESQFLDPDDIFHATLNTLTSFQTSGNSIDFDDPTAWIGGVVPPTLSNIVIAHDLTLNQDYTANNILIEDNITFTTSSNVRLSSLSLTLNANSELVLEPGSVLKVSANIINNGTLYFKSDGINGSAQFDEFNGIISGSGEVTTERFIPAKRIYRFHSSRVNSSGSINSNWQEGATTASTPPNPNPGYGTHITGGTVASGFDQTATNNPSMFTFHNTFVPTGTETQNNAYVPITNTSSSTLNAGQPKLIFIRGDRSINLQNNSAAPTNTILRATGDLHTGNLTFNVGNPTDYLNLNPEFELLSLVANPYQAVVDYNKVARDDLTEYIYVWDVNLGGTNSRGGYITIETPSVAGTFNAPKPGLSDLSQFLAPGMPFFVQNLDSGYADITAPFSPSLTFNEDDKTTDGTEINVFNTYSNFYINSRVYKTIDQQNGNRESDALGLRFSSNYTTPGSSEDATKLFNNRVTYASDNNGLRAIDKRGMPNIGDEIDLFMLFTQPEATSYSLTYTIENNPIGLGVFLKDDYLNTQTEITDNFVYDFTINTTIPGSIATDRFSLLFDSSIGFEDNTFGSDFTLYPNPTSNGQFSINTPNLSGEVNVEITSLLGQNVFLQKLPVAGNQVDVAAPNLSRGIYIVKLAQENQSFRTKLIVE